MRARSECTAVRPPPLPPADPTLPPNGAPASLYDAGTSSGDTKASRTAVMSDGATPWGPAPAWRSAQSMPRHTAGGTTRTLRRTAHAAAPHPGAPQGAGSWAPSSRRREAISAWGPSRARTMDSPPADTWRTQAPGWALPAAGAGTGVTAPQVAHDVAEATSGHRASHRASAPVALAADAACVSACTTAWTAAAALTGWLAAACSWAAARAEEADANRFARWLPWKPRVSAEANSVRTARTGHGCEAVCGGRGSARMAARTAAEACSATSAAPNASPRPPGCCPPDGGAVTGSAAGAAAGTGVGEARRGTGVGGPAAGAVGRLGVGRVNVCGRPPPPDTAVV